jgi:chromosome segregation ATPase
MPERLERLRTTVEELEGELRNLDSIDDETRSVLYEAIDEIQSALARRDAAKLESNSLGERLHRSVESFEESHPTLAGIVMRVADLLGQIGI